MKRHPLRIMLCVMAMVLLGLTIGTLPTSAQDDMVAFTNVSDGQTISALTVLEGTITFPDFLKYEIFLQSGNSLIWVANSHGRVINGSLARLDPRSFQSGSYQLVVRKVNSDSNYTDELGPTITIDNPNGSPAPYYLEVEPSFLYPSEQFAVLRVRNCTGEDFNFDYTSPDGFKSAGDATLPGKPTGETICVFQDIALIPGEYRGTGQGGGQTEGAPFTIVVDEWMTFELLYNGPGAGHNMIIAQQVPFDEGQGDAMPMHDEQANVAAVAQPAPETILPTTGDLAEDASRFPVVLVVLLLLVLGAGGAIAVWKKPFSRSSSVERQ